MPVVTEHVATMKTIMLGKIIHGVIQEVGGKITVYGVTVVSSGPLYS